MAVDKGRGKANDGDETGAADSGSAAETGAASISSEDSPAGGAAGPATEKPAAAEPGEPGDAEDSQAGGDSPADTDVTVKRATGKASADDAEVAATVKRPVSKKNPAAPTTDDADDDDGASAGDDGDDVDTGDEDADDDAAAAAPAKVKRSSGKKGASKKAPKPAALKAKAADTPARKRWVEPVAAFAAGVLLVAAVTAVVVFFLQSRDRGEELDAGREASEAACNVVRGFVSYDAPKQNMDEWAQKLANQGTAQWKERFLPEFQRLKAGLVAEQVKSTPRDVQCGVAKVEDDKKTVKVIVSVYQVVQSNMSQGKPAAQLSGMTATMKKVDGRWLMDNLDSKIFHES